MNSQFSNCEIISGQKVYYKSCESMEEVGSDSIDVIVTSPLYNVGKTYADDFNSSYNDNLSQEGYLQFLTTVWKECFRVLKKSGVFFLNIGDSAKDQGKSELVARTAVSAGFIRIQTIIWVKSIFGKGHYTPSGGKRRLNNAWEYIFMFAKDRNNYHINPLKIGIPYADKSNIGRYAKNDKRDPGDVWFIPYTKTTGATIKKGHEAPFPVQLPINCIKLSEGKTVLDPFAGTGTTLQACNYLGVQGIAYEKYPKKELIKGTISDIDTIKEQPPILIPHLERSVLLLVNLISKLGISPEQIEYVLKNGKPSLSKQSNFRLVELIGVLKRLGYTGAFLQGIESMITLEKNKFQSDKEGKVKKRLLTDFL